jgi:hypothetical protein
MKKLYVAAALLMASTAAHAGNSISFELEGKKIHIEAPKNCNQLSCIKITAPGLSGSGFDLKGFKSNHFDDDNDVADNSNPPAPSPPAAPAVQAAPQPAAPAMNSTPPAPVTVASTAPAPVVNDVIPQAPPPAAVATPAPRPTPVAAAPAPTTPLGVWATEENKGNVRIEQCGQNLCGYTEKTGERVLINMKPSESKWTGQIHDPDSGRNYDSTIAMKGPNLLKVQGCAFGGLFCGGQTWKRVG